MRAVSDEVGKNKGKEQFRETILKEFVEDIWKKADGNLNTFIMRFLSETGVELSGGQRQKFAKVWV